MPRSVYKEAQHREGFWVICCTDNYVELIALNLAWSTLRSSNWKDALPDLKHPKPGHHEHSPAGPGGQWREDVEVDAGGNHDNGIKNVPEGWGSGSMAQSLRGNNKVFACV